MPPAAATGHTVAAMLLAHGSGWDEMLLVSGPIVAVIGLVLLVRRRVNDQAGRLAAQPTEISAPSDRNLPGKSS